MSPDVVRSWLDTFPAAKVQERLCVLAARRQKIEIEEQELRALLEMHTRRTRLAVVEQQRLSLGTAPQGMDAVEQVMRERPGSWKRIEIQRALTEKGWLAPGAAGKATLGSILHRMVSRERVIRLGGGRYKLPAPADQGVIAA